MSKRGQVSKTTLGVTLTVTIVSTSKYAAQVQEH